MVQTPAMCFHSVASGGGDAGTGPSPARAAPRARGAPAVGPLMAKGRRLASAGAGKSAEPSRRAAFRALFSIRRSAAYRSNLTSPRQGWTARGVVCLKRSVSWTAGALLDIHGTAWHATGCP